MLLAIDVPRGNEQTPRAVEDMFCHLAGAHGSINLIENYWLGKTQDYFSFEIVSIEGYTQYLVRTERKYRSLIESIIYATYSDAEISEVDDYVTEMPDSFPDDNYDIWGGEWILVKSDAYPFRTYIDFEHQLSGDFKDPMAAIMELFNSLKKGEQCWYQIILTPIGSEWEKKGEEEISKILGEKTEAKKNIFDKAAEGLIKALGSFSEFIFPLWGDIKEKEEDQVDSFKMFNLKPAEKKAIDAIQQKVSKLGFEVKIRFIYIAEKEIMDGSKSRSFVGAMKQYGIGDLNALKPDMAVTATSAHYVFKQSRLNTRKSRLIQAYKSRSNWLGRNRFALNVEELATLWHFPIEEESKAPMLQKVSSRKTEAPGYLPIEGVSADMGSEILVEEGGERQEKEEIFSMAEGKSEGAKTEKQETAPAGPPANLPIG